MGLYVYTLSLFTSSSDVQQPVKLLTQNIIHPHTSYITCAHVAQIHTHTPYLYISPTEETAGEETTTPTLRPTKETAGEGTNKHSHPTSH